MSGKSAASWWPRRKRTVRRTSSSSSTSRPSSSRSPGLSRNQDSVSSPSPRSRTTNSDSPCASISKGSVMCVAYPVARPDHRAGAGAATHRARRQARDMTDTSGPPFRADHVGSLLRPQGLLEARARFAAGEIDAAELRGVEDEAIADVVRMQGDVGLRTATDGEFRRASWHMDFIYAIGGISKVTGEDIVVHFKNADGTIDFTPAGLHVDGPLSIDEPINAALAGRPEGLTVTTHMCRGNFRSSWVAEGGYDFVAEALFGGLEVDGFFLEYDDARSGGFEPLRFVPPGKRVVLGLVTTKRPELESRDDLRRRIDEAARYVPLEQLALSPQCGFSSTVEGNALTRDEQIAKLALVVETAQEVWGY